MDIIKKKYIIDEQKRKVAVQIDIDDFNKIEEVLEDYALGQLIQENDPAETLDIETARKFYAGLKKG